MGLFDSLFGRERETVQPQAPQISQVPSLTPEQTELLKSLIGNVSTAAGAFGGRTAPFTGDLTAPVSGLENLAFGSIEELFTPGGQVQDFISGALTPFSEEETIRRFEQFQVPFAREQQAESRRQLLESLSGTGGFTSGATSRALARGETGFNLGLQSLLGQQLNVAEQRADVRNIGGLNALLGIQQQGIAGGGVERGIEQAGLDRILNEFIRQQGIDPLLGLTPTLLGTSAFENVIQFPQTITSPTAASQISSLLGGAGRLASGIGSFFP